MPANIKINPSIATTIAGKFTQHAGELDGIISSLESQVTSNIGDGKPGWEGQQANDFDNSWNGEFKPALKKLVEALNGANDLLRKTIAAFESIDGQ